ncbi:MAG: S8 family peptidase, partial [Sphingobacteriaceae bacterium]
LNNEDLGSAVIKGFNILTNEDFSFNRDCIQDTDGHGTACATIIASRGVNGIIGVAPACNLIIIKVAKSNNELDLKRTLPKGIEKAIELGAHIISISAGFKHENKPEDETVAIAIKKYWRQHLFVSAAGNKRSYIAYPANIPGMISVGAIGIDKDGNYKIALDTAKGESDSVHEGITIVAPGERVPVYNLTKSTIDFSGASAAAPFVAGILTLLLAYQKQINGSFQINHEAIRKGIINSAFNPLTANDKTLWGNGIIDPVKLILTQNILA